MSGNVWMFSDQIDDEDIDFMHREFVTYNMASIRRASRIIRTAYLSGAMEMEKPRVAAYAVVRKSSFAAIFPAAKRYIRSTSKLLPMPTRWKCTKRRCRM